MKFLSNAEQFKERPRLVMSKDRTVWEAMDAPASGWDPRGMKRGCPEERVGGLARCMLLFCLPYANVCGMERKRRRALCKALKYKSEKGHPDFR
jgi:hypothetical protein